MITHNDDYSDLLREFNAAKVKYLVVGAHALAVHGYVRASGDLDVWVEAAPENAARVHEALRKFGAPLEDVGADDFTKSNLVFQVGVEPVRIDVLTSIDGVEFEHAWKRRIEARTTDGVALHALSVEDLIANKKACGRPQDVADVERLERFLER